jgi:hypothetical protein
MRGVAGETKTSRSFIVTGIRMHTTSGLEDLIDDIRIRYFFGLRPIPTLSRIEDLTAVATGPLTSVCEPSPTAPSYLSCSPIGLLSSGLLIHRVIKCLRYQVRCDLFQSRIHTFENVESLTQYIPDDFISSSLEITCMIGIALYIVHTLDLGVCSQSNSPIIELPGSMTFE